MAEAVGLEAAVGAGSVADVLAGGRGGELEADVAVLRVDGEAEVVVLEAEVAVLRVDGEAEVVVLLGEFTQRLFTASQWPVA